MGTWNPWLTDCYTQASCFRPRRYGPPERFGDDMVLGFRVWAYGALQSTQDLPRKCSTSRVAIRNHTQAKQTLLTTFCLPPNGGS